MDCGGYFVNHDQSGHTRNGAGVMVEPASQGHGVGDPESFGNAAVIEKLNPDAER